MDKKDQEIRNKLEELESSISEKPGQVIVSETSSQLAMGEKSSSHAELCLLSGIVLALTGFFLFLHHIQIGSSLLTMFGMGQQGVGLILVLLLGGLGLLFYDYKMKLGWVLTAASCAFLFFTVLSNLVVYFTPTSLFGLLIILLPLALGAALIAKGISSSNDGKKRGAG